MALRLKGSAQKRKAEAIDVIDRMTDFKRRADWMSYVQKLEKWDVQWRGTMSRLNKPWDHASDYNPPMTFSKVEDVHAIMHGFFSNFDFFSVAASSKKGFAMEMLKKKARNITDLLKWSLQNESNSVAFLDEFIHNGLLYGSAFGHLSWFRDTKTIQAEFFIPEDVRESSAAPLKLLKEALGSQLVGRPEALGEDAWSIRFIDDDGEEKDARAWVDRNHPFRPEGEAVIIVERDSIIYDAPRPRVVPSWNMMVPEDAPDLQTAERFWVREHMSYRQISELASNGLFNALSDKDLRELREFDQNVAGRAESGQRSSSEVDDVDYRRDVELEVSKIEGRQRGIEIHFEYAYEKVNGSYASVIRAALDQPRPMLLMRQRLEYLYPHGRRPFFDWHFLPIDGRYHGMGIPEMLERGQIEENSYYQSRSDVLEIITKPGGLYDPMSGLAPEEIRYRPGMFIKARDVGTAFREFNFSTDPSFLFREQAGIELQAERAVGSTDMGLGRGPTRPNAPRTLGGTAIVVRQQQLRMDVFLKRVMFGSGETAGGVQEFLQQYMALYGAFMPNEKEFRVMGTDEISVVSRKDLQGRYDFLVDFGPEINNPQLRMQNATLRLQTAMTNPLILQNQQAMWHILIDFLEATGMHSAARIVPPPAGMDDRPPMSQEEEFLVLGRGIYIDPLPSDNHGEHLAAITSLIQDPIQLAQFFGPETMPLLGRHTQRHMEFFMAIQAQPELAPGANGRQQRVQGSMTLQEPQAGPIETDVERGLTP